MLEIACSFIPTHIIRGADDVVVVVDGFVVVGVLTSLSLLLTEDDIYHYVQTLIDRLKCYFNVLGTI